MMALTDLDLPDDTPIAVCTAIAFLEDIRAAWSYGGALWEGRIGWLTAEEWRQTATVPELALGAPPSQHTASNPSIAIIMSRKRVAPRRRRP
jgi:hypothetical protein